LRWENVGFQILQQAVYTDKILQQVVYTDQILQQAVYTDQILQQAVYTDQTTQSFTELTTPGQVHCRICNRSLSLRQQIRPSLSEINT